MTSPTLLVAHLLLLLCAMQCPTSHCQPSDTSYGLVWSEEFNYANGAQPSSSAWNWQTGAGGFGHGELQFYTARPTNSYVNNSALVVQAQYESYYGSPYTSAQLTTQGKVEVYLGYVATRARISMANGFWPAVRLLGSSALGWPWSGEIDCMMQVNGQSASPNPDDHSQYGGVQYNAAGISNPTTPYTAAQAGGAINTSSAATLWGDAYHIYAFEWTATTITFSVDNVTYATVCTTCSVGTNTFRNASNPFYLVINLAMGGDLPGVAPAAASLPGQLMVDWVRVWQKNDGLSYIVAPAAVVANNTSAFSSSSSSSSSSTAAAASSSSRASSASSGPSSSFSSSSTTTSDSAPLLTDWSPPDPSYLLAWHEEFDYTDGSQPSSSIWNWQTGGNGWGNEELEYYTTRPVNSYISNGTLVVAGQWESYSGHSITSARMTTDHKVELYLGVVATRARVQGMQNGYWPSVWMMGNKSDTLGWPWCGEIDIYEQVNGLSAPGTPSDDHYQHASLHYNQNGQTASAYNPMYQTSVVSTGNAAVLWGDSWHVYSMQWTTSAITFSVDSTAYGTFDLSSANMDTFRDPSNPYYFLVDFAFGGQFPDVAPAASAFPAHLEVDWVRVYQKQDGVSYVNAPASSLVAAGSSSSAVPSASSSSSAAISVSASSESSVPGSESSTGGSTVHTSGARLRSDAGLAWLVGATLLCVVAARLC